MRPLAALTTLIAVTLTLAACGSDSLSARQLRTGAARACNLARRQTNRIATPSVPSEGRSFLSRGIAALAPLQKTLGELQPPGDMATDYRTAVDASGKELAALRFTLTGMKAGNDPVVAIKTLQAKLAPVEARGDAAWHSLQIPACAVG